MLYSTWKSDLEFKQLKHIVLPLFYISVWSFSRATDVFLLQVSHLEKKRSLKTVKKQKGSTVYMWINGQSRCQWCGHLKINPMVSEKHFRDSYISQRKVYLCFEGLNKSLILILSSSQIGSAFKTYLNPVIHSLYTFIFTVSKNPSCYF